MRKRVLVAEASDTVRRVAENVLRQNGFEVVSVSSSDKAREVLQLSRPDLILVGGDLKTADDRPYYEKLRSNSKTASIPFLVFEPLEAADLPFPQEVIIRQPFDPKEFIARVQAFSGGDAPEGARNVLADLSADDDFLDSALGLDRIDVTDSEVLDRTSATPLGTRGEKLVGLDHFDRDEELSDSNRVESLMIRDEQSDTGRKAKAASGTSKLEIMKDQYGLEDPGAFQQDKGDAAHDYDWFVNSMRDEVTAPATPSVPAKSVSDSSKLRITPPASMVEPVTPGPGQTVTRPAKPAKGSRTAGVEKFIDEFKKEIERLRSSDTDSVFVEEVGADQGADEESRWEETVERLEPAEAQLFSRQLAEELAKQIATQIVAKIDPERLMQMVTAEIVARYRDRKR